MIIQSILSLGLLGCLFYVVSLGNANRAMRVLLFGIVMLGFVFVWMPGITNVIAAYVGVGRGADLVMYIWIVLNLLFILRLHLKLREQSEALTLLARRIALSSSAQQPSLRQPDLPPNGIDHDYLMRPVS
jgi:hypothetical protein